MPLSLRYSVLPTSSLKKFSKSFSQGTKHLKAFTIMALFPLYVIVLVFGLRGSVLAAAYWLLRIHPASGKHSALRQLLQALPTALLQTTAVLIQSVKPSYRFRVRNSGYGMVLLYTCVMCLNNIVFCFSTFY